MLGSQGVAGRRRRRRRQRRRGRQRRPNNSPIWPEPWTITPRDQISRSGSIPHFDIVRPSIGDRSDGEYVNTKKLKSNSTRKPLESHTTRESIHEVMNLTRSWQICANLKYVSLEASFEASFRFFFDTGRTLKLGQKCAKKNRFVCAGGT